MTSGAKLGFLVKTYSKGAATFILEELLGLERHGLIDPRCVRMGNRVASLSGTDGAFI
jgi:hypothetical protein